MASSAPASSASFSPPTMRVFLSFLTNHAPSCLWPFPLTLKTSPSLYSAGSLSFFTFLFVYLPLMKLRGSALVPHKAPSPPPPLLCCPVDMDIDLLHNLQWLG